ncbi:alanine racemase [Nocardioides mangrovi]|uniref:Alanine racemase n=1 Tax=Nocardioides mangrovi TaxID=2874580 RepID=A0ABS7UFX8_9ACTN|nr:alanine racemase [Nocardioides mangrovi]MBZ5739700.1 alanine racemase [Nocardioides mangrovi]
MTPAVRAEIVVDLDAIRHNVRALRELTGVPSMTVVKADGYGHGMVEVARAAREAGSEWIGVATIDEALALRAAGDTGPLLCWLTVPGDDWAAAIDAGVDVTAYSVAELGAIAATGRRARVQLKVDTGLSRGGATAQEWPDVVARAVQGERDGSWTITGIWSHLAASDEPAHPANDAQQEAFERALEQAADLSPEVRHLANSAAGILRPSSRYDLVRFGLASYGLDPAPGETPDLGLVPAMTAHASLALTKPIHAGDGVSYGHTWVADTDTTVGLVPLGYGDGVPRHASNAAHVLVDGKQRAMRGRVCMDQFVVDLGGDRPEPGSDVVLFGPGDHGEPTAQDWAEAAGTISYEIVTRIGGRMTRRYVGTSAR